MYKILLAATNEQYAKFQDVAEDSHDYSAYGVGFHEADAFHTLSDALEAAQGIANGFMEKRGIHINIYSDDAPSAIVEYAVSVLEEIPFNRGVK